MLQRVDMLSLMRRFELSISIFRIILVKGKGATLHFSVGGLFVFVSWTLIPEAVRPLKSVPHGQCDARPTVTFPAADHRRPLTGARLYW